MSTPEDKKDLEKAFLENQDTLKKFMEIAISQMEEAKAEQEKYREDSKNQKPQSFYVPKIPHWNLSIDGSGIDDLLKLTIGLAKIYPNPNFKISEQQFKIPKNNPEEQK